MKFFVKFLLLLLTVSTVAACFEDSPTRVIINHLFEIEMELTPFQKVYPTGSTIHITANIADKTLVDLLTDEPVFIPNTTFENTIGVGEVGDIPDTEDWVEFFVVEGDSVSYNRTLFGATSIQRFGCPEDTYVLDIEITFPVAGNYGIMINGSTLSSIFFTDEGDCSITASFTQNNLPERFHVADVRYVLGLEDVNLDVFQDEAQGAVWDSNLEDLLTDKQAFFVKVVD